MSGLYNSYVDIIDKTDLSTTTIPRPNVMIPSLHSTNTADGKVHVVYKWNPNAGEEGGEGSGSSITDGLQHEYFSNGSPNIETIYEYSGTGTFSFVNISSTHNDLYAIWKAPNSDYLIYRQYNTAPAAPKDLTLSNNQGHPRLRWSNINADVQSFNIYRNYAGWMYLNNTSNLEYTDPGIIINTGQEFGTNVDYRIKSVDANGVESVDYSNTVTCNTPGGDIDKTVGLNEKITSYELSQNYPNPFNPSTNISYQIPNAGLVQLKVYDLLGKEVAVLVNEFKPEGKYSVNFNASNLSSGLYIYSLRVNDFVQNHKLTLLK